ncbi:MAG: hypothetical protein M1829_003556 [Trizodia sp. TS-e1964]|nr:MAG: hypothetical protein M1829_003556 [Trizodia sp. TS-e1964]
MADSLSPQEKVALIKENLQEVLKPEIIEDIVVKQNRPLIIYWGTATTGRPHCGYFVPIIKLAQFLQAGCTVKILLADIHGFLDNLKAPLELVEHRAAYYKHLLTSLLGSLSVPISRLEFVLGSSFQRTPGFIMDFYKLCTVVSEHDAKKAGAEVVKQVASPLLSGLIYPLMQALDEEHLKVDAQFGGVDQRKIFTLAQEFLPRIGYRERAHLMNPMVPGLAGGKMSSSDPDSKIDLLDTADAVQKKIRKAYAVPKEVEGNGILSFVEYVLLPVSALKTGSPRFIIDQRRENESAEVPPDLVYSNIESLKHDYTADVVTPQLLKSGVSNALVELLKPIHADFEANKEWQEIAKAAYPSPVAGRGAAEKKKKPAKDKGSRHPGAAAKILGEASDSAAEPGKKDAGQPAVVTLPDGSVKGEGSIAVSLALNSDLSKFTTAETETFADGTK